MNNEIYCSTGAYIGPQNSFDYRLIPKYAAMLDCDALELMMLRAWYPYLDAAADFLAGSGVRFAVIHSDKQIGVLLSDGGEENRREALRLFRLSAEVGRKIHAPKLVLHLWGGPGTDGDMPSKIKTLGEIYKISADCGIETLVENVPCGIADPLSHWKEIEAAYPDARFIFDTRFGAFHSQLDTVFEQGWFDGRVKHMHVSDFAGQPGEFKKLRPIPMPREGNIGARFDSFFERLKPLYDGGITLESPSLADDGSVGTDELNRAFAYIRRSTR